MVKHFLNLEIKAFLRSASVGKSIALKVLLGFLALYFMLSFLFLGFALFPLLQENFPKQKPIEIVNNAVIFWLAIDLIFRFFMQSLPVMNIKPLLILPIKREKVIHFVLLKSLVSIYNIFPLLVILPFGITTIIQENLNTAPVLVWMLTLYVLALCVNYANFLIKKKFADNIKAFLVFALLGGTFAALEYFEIFKISSFIGGILNSVLLNPILVLAPLMLLGGLYFWNFNYLKSNFYLDNSLQSKVQEAKTSDLSWTKRFGEIAPFLQLDLKLIWRNKRPRTTVFMSFIFLLYGLMIYTNPKHHELSFIHVPIGLLMSGIFMVNFGQFIPSWDSGYFGMMMSQNIPLRKYLDSKSGLMTFSVIVLALLTTPYVYFGWNILAVNLACALYNIGINIPVLLFAGSYNKKRIDLEKSPFMNYQGTGASQWIVGLPLFLIPGLIFFGFSEIFNTETAILAIAAFGIIGLLFRNLIMNAITDGYRTRKYATLNGFKQQEN
ncbi:MAG: hypothetical protein RL308_2447 [Bacteroidota bacterium]|jgi:hypothetical protein